jgi:hypothetical protein
MGEGVIRLERRGVGNLRRRKESRYMAKTNVEERVLVVDRGTENVTSAQLSFGSLSRWGLIRDSEPILAPEVVE